MATRMTTDGIYGERVQFRRAPLLHVFARSNVIGIRECLGYAADTQISSVDGNGPSAVCRVEFI